MNLQKWASVLGSALTSFLLAGAATIELLMATIGGDIAPGIIGVFTGSIAGLAVGAAVASQWPALGGGRRAAVLGYSVFGLAMLFLALLSYVHTPVIAQYLGLRPNLVIAAVVAIAVWLAASRQPDQRTA